MTVEKLLSLIPADLIELLEAETQVNYQVKKLHADTVFKLILFSMLEHDKVSLRVMETFASTAKFRHLSGVELDTRYNSIRDRICTMNPDFFHQLYQQIFELYSNYLSEQNSLVKVDSTIVSIASNLVNWSLGCGGRKTDRKHVKFSVAMKGSLPCSVKIFTQSEMASEDKALGHLLEEGDFMEGKIVVFDKGIQSRRIFDKLSDDKQIFVSRLRPKLLRTRDEKSVKIPDKPSTATVTIHQDSWCYLFGKQNKQTSNCFRVIKGVIDSSQEEIIFITNSKDLTCYQVAALYKQRWEIEVLFKFLKQHLNLNHLVSRNENGIQVMIYMTMILAILILAYRKINKISSYKIAKLKLTLQLDEIMTKQIVILCGGDPAKAPHLFRDS